MPPYPMPEPSPDLSEQDVRKIIALLGDLAVTPGDLNEKRRWLMEGLCPMVAADAWLWCMANYQPGQPLSHGGMIHGGFGDARFARFLEAINHPAMESVSRHSAIELHEKGCHITRTLAQLECPTARLMDSPAGPLWEKAGIGTLMLSFRPMPEGGATGIGFYRETGASHFDQREAKIAHVVLSEVPWLHYQHFTEMDRVIRLYPRHRTILNLLSDGWSRKKIAAHLAISENTVHGYVRRIYKHFAVHSHAELIARLTKGDGGDL